MGYPLVIQQFATEAMANKKFDDLTYEWWFCIAMLD